jgi:type IV pilus assembly protein PilX
MKNIPVNGFGVRHQRGVVLLVSLLFLLLLTLLGVSSMQNATLQEKMAGSVTNRNVTFQGAEATLLLGEAWVQIQSNVPAACNSLATCAPPSDSTTIERAGNGVSGQPWREATGGGLFTVQNLGPTPAAISRPSGCKESSTVTMYRITSVFIQGVSRTVLESIYATC